MIFIINLKYFVYETIDLFKLYFSNSAGSFYGFDQTSQCYEVQNGVDLNIELDEVERICKLFNWFS